MTRADSLKWLQDRYASLYVKAGLEVTDSTGGFRPVLDSAWVLLGLANGTDAPQSMSQQWEAALEFHALKRVALEFVQKYSKAFAGMSLQTYQTFQGIQKMLEAATKRLVTVGLASPDGVEPALASYDEIILRPRRTVPVRRYVGGITEWG